MNIKFNFLIFCVFHYDTRLRLKVVSHHCTMKNLLKAKSVHFLRFLYRKLKNFYILPDEMHISVP